MGIMAKLLLGIIPVVIIGINVVSLVSGQMASNAILEETNNHMDAVLESNIKDIEGQLQEIRTTAQLLSLYVGDSYKTTDINSYARLFKDVVAGNELISGSGIWFEPGVRQTKKLDQAIPMPNMTILLRNITSWPSKRIRMKRSSRIPIMILHPIRLWLPAPLLS